MPLDRFSGSSTSTVTRSVGALPTVAATASRMASSRVATRRAQSADSARACTSKCSVRNDVHDAAARVGGSMGGSGPAGCAASGRTAASAKQVSSAVRIQVRARDDAWATGSRYRSTAGFNRTVRRFLHWMTRAVPCIRFARPSEPRCNRRHPADEHAPPARPRATRAPCQPAHRNVRAAHRTRG